MKPLGFGLGAAYAYAYAPYYGYTYPNVVYADPVYANPVYVSPVYPNPGAAYAPTCGQWVWNPGAGRYDWVPAAC